MIWVEYLGMYCLLHLHGAVWLHVLLNNEDHAAWHSSDLHGV